MTSPLTPRSARLFPAGTSGPLAQWYILIALASRAKSPAGSPFERSVIAAFSCLAISGTNALYSGLSGSFLGSRRNFRRMWAKQYCLSPRHGLS